VRVQPEECIYWKVQNKVPGLKFEVEQVRMDLLYAKSFMREHLPAAYERLLLECLVGDHSHFVSPQELEAQWQVFDSLLHELRERRVRPETYAFGSRGPSGADALARRHGMSKFGGGLTPYVTLGERAAETARAHKKGAVSGTVVPRRLPTLGPLTAPAHRVPTTE
jgi:glucose-6-phosphate 1-dehydrogenase